MPIVTIDPGYAGSAKQESEIVKTAGRTSVAAQWFSVFDLAGQPGAGTLAGASTAAGIVPTDVTAGYPLLNAFGGGAQGILANLSFTNTVASRMRLYDRLFLAGAYAFNASTSLASQPSYLARTPASNGADCEIWIEAVTAFTGNLSVAVTYTNQAGTAARTTGTFATGAALTVGRCMQLPLQAGDSGVQKIESVTGTVATAGTFNVMVLRRLSPTLRVKIANDSDLRNLLDLGMPRVYEDSALYALIAADSTSTGVPEINFQVANG